MPLIYFDDLKAELKRVLLKKGGHEDVSDLCAQLFTETTCDGIYSHGVNRFLRMVAYIDKGHIQVNATPTKVDGIGGFERRDGNQGLGNVNAKLAMDRAIELARQNGIGCVALRNTNHWMRGGSYGWQAANAGCIGLCWTNTIPNMPAWGATDRRIGNNPFIMSVPRAGGGHVVVDMAMAQFSYGQLEATAQRGDLLPVPGGYDAAGELSCDPNAIASTGRVLPVGFWKGSGLSIVLDLVATVLSGGKSAFRIGQLGPDECQVSQVFVAIDATRIAGNDFLASAVNDVLDNVKASERVAEDQAIRYPAEKEVQTRQHNLAQGIPVDDGVWEQIRAL